MKELTGKWLHSSYKGRRLIARTVTIFYYGSENKERNLAWIQTHARNSKINKFFLPETNNFLTDIVVSFRDTERGGLMDVL
jgi:hypothetical protein